MRKFILVLFLVATVNCFSATRQDIQAANDLIKCVNITNDFTDNLVPILRSGKTIEEKKESIIKVGKHIRMYKSRIDIFLSYPENRTQAISGLNALSVDIQGLKDDMILIDSTINTIKENIDNIKTQKDMNTLADTIESTIPKLPLVRKAE